MKNIDRAATVASYLLDFEREVGLTHIHDGPATVGGDIICNILHWVAEKGGIEAALEAVRSGISHFLIEQAAGPGADDADGERNEVGRIASVDREGVWVTLRRHHPLLDEWDNQVQLYDYRPDFPSWAGCWIEPAQPSS